jgi:hypothetical protein
MNALSNARHPGESFANYRARRVLTQAVVDKSLKGRACYAGQIDNQGKGVPYRRPEDAISSKGRGKRRRQAFKPLPLEERIVKEGV